MEQDRQQAAGQWRLDARIKSAYDVEMLSASEEPFTHDVLSAWFACLRKQRGDLRAQFLFRRDPIRKGNADQSFLIADIETFRIEADGAPCLLVCSTIGLRQIMCEVRLFFGDFRKQVRFFCREIVGLLNRSEKLRGRNIRGAAEAAVQMRGFYRDMKESEIDEIGIDARFRMAREKARAQHAFNCISCTLRFAKNR